MSDSFADDLIDVSSEDEGEVKMSDVINNIVKKLQDAPEEKIKQLNKLNDELLNNQSDKIQSSS